MCEKKKRKVLMNEGRFQIMVNQNISKTTDVRTPSCFFHYEQKIIFKKKELSSQGLSRSSQGQIQAQY